MLWGAIKKYITLSMKDHPEWRNDQCLNYFSKISKTIVKDENTEILKTSYPDLAKAFMETGMVTRLHNLTEFF